MSNDPATSRALPALDPERAERLRRMFEAFIPFHRHLGLQVDHVDRGSAVIRIPWRDELLGDPSRNAIHGGVISALADAAGGIACFAMLDKPEDRVSTVDLRVDYLRPGAPGDIVCEARIVRFGNRMAVTRSHVYVGDLPPDDDHDKAIATAQAVYNIVRR